MRFAKLTASVCAAATMLTVGSIWAFSEPAPAPKLSACATTACSATQSPCNLLATALASGGLANGPTTLAKACCDQTQSVAAKSQCQGETCCDDDGGCEKTVPVSTTKSDCQSGTCPVSAKSKCCGDDCGKKKSCEGGTCPVSAKSECQDDCCDEECSEKTVPVSTKKSDCESGTCPVSAKGDCKSACCDEGCDHKKSCEGGTCPVSAKSECKDDCCDEECSKKTVPVSTKKSDCESGTCPVSAKSKCCGDDCGKKKSCEGGTCPVSMKSDCKKDCCEDECSKKTVPVSTKSHCETGCCDGTCCTEGTCQSDCCQESEDACSKIEAVDARIPVAAGRPCHGDSCKSECNGKKCPSDKGVATANTAGCEAATPRACKPVVAQRPEETAPPVRARHAVRVRIHYSLSEGPSIQIVRWSEDTEHHSRLEELIPPPPSPPVARPVFHARPMAAGHPAAGSPVHAPCPHLDPAVPHFRHCPLAGIPSKLGPPVGVFTSGMFPCPRVFTSEPAHAPHHPPHPPVAWHSPHPRMAPPCLAGRCPVPVNYFVHQLIAAPRPVPAPWTVPPSRPVVFHHLPSMPPPVVHAPHPAPKPRMVAPPGPRPVPHHRRPPHQQRENQLWHVSFLNEGPTPGHADHHARPDHPVHRERPITGTWEQTVGETTVRVTCERTRIHGKATFAGLDESPASGTIAFSGTCSITPDGQLFGVIDYLSLEMREGVGTEKFESEMIDQPFAFRFRTDGQTLFIKDVKCPGLELLWAENGNKSASGLGRHILSAFVRGKYTRAE